MDRNDLTDTVTFGTCGRFAGNETTNTTGHVICSPRPIRGRFVFITRQMVDSVLCLCEATVFAGMHRDVTIGAWITETIS